MKEAELVKIAIVLRERQEAKAKRQGSGGRNSEPPLYREIQAIAEQSYDQLEQI